MVDPSFVIRAGPSGPDMPLSTPGNVLTVQPDGISVAAEPSSAGVAITPLGGVQVVDGASTATTPTGAWSGNAAQPTLSDALVVLAPLGAGNIYLARGSYSETLAFDGLNLTVAGLNSEETVLGGSITLNGANNVRLTLRGLLCSAAIVAAPTESATQTLKLVETTYVTGSIDGSNLSVVIRDSEVDVIVGTTEVANIDAEGSSFAADLTSLGAQSFRLCRIAGTVTISAGTLAMDAESEFSALSSGAGIIQTITALSLGQDGDAVALLNNATLDFTAETRGYIPRGTTAKTFALALTGAIGGETFFVDNWGGQNTVQFNAVTIGPAGGDLPAETAGSGTRYCFQVTTDASAIVFQGSKQLAG